MTQSRQLAAIMFTDIVGYTALMGKDERQAFELLKKNRQVQRPIIEKYNGRWLKEMGDGVLASFSSVSDAVYCAAEIQKVCASEPDLRLRIGIHLGEVVFENNDVFGDGVNIASRIEPLAPVGGILVTEPVYKNLVNKQGITSAFIGEEQLKNIQEPVRVYQVYIEEAALMTEQTSTPSKKSNKAGVSGKRLLIIIGIVLMSTLGYFLISRSDIASQGSQQTVEITDKSIAVLPFANMSNDEDQQYFSDGMSEEIINALAQIPNLKVASRTSAFQFRGDNQDIKSIAKTLGVATVLEGSVRKSQNRVRVTAQLINASDGFHLWSQTYERELNDIFAIQDELSGAIVDALELKISETDGDIVSQGTSNMEAHNLYLKGRYFWNFRDSESVSKALGFFQQAIEQDSTYALAYSGLADSYNMMGPAEDPVILMRKVKEAAYKAIELDNSLAQAHAALGFTEMMTDWNYQAAANSFKRAISLNPNYAPAHQWYAELLYLAGDSLTALEEIDKSLEVDPLNLIINLNQARYYMRIGEYNTAIALARKVLELNANFEPAHWTLYNAYYGLGDLDTAFEHFIQGEYTRLIDDEILNEAYTLSGWKGVLEKSLEIIRSDNSESYIDPITIAELYLINDDYSSAIPYLEMSVNRRKGGLIFIGLNPFWRPYHEEPRFQALLQKMGLPVILD